jgi:hypothetical protein
MTEEQQELVDFETLWRVWGRAIGGGQVLVSRRLYEAAIKAGYPAERLQVAEDRA